MGSDQAMIVAGIGCRKGCPAEAIVALVREAGVVDALAAPEWKRGEAGLLEAADLLGLPLVFVGREALAAVQERCVTRSAVVADAVGFASVAEAAALAGGAVLQRPRFGGGWATCAIAAPASSPPPVGGAGGGVAAAPLSPVCPTRPKDRARGTPPPGPLPQGEGEKK